MSNGCSGYCEIFYCSSCHSIKDRAVRRYCFTVTVKRTGKNRGVCRIYGNIICKIIISICFHSRKFLCGRNGRSLGSNVSCIYSHGNNGSYHKYGNNNRQKLCEFHFFHGFPFVISKTRKDTLRNI